MYFIWLQTSSYKNKQSKCKYKSVLARQIALDIQQPLDNNHLNNLKYLKTDKHLKLSVVEWKFVASDRWNSSWLEVKMPWILPTSLVGEPDSYPAAKRVALNKLQ